MFIKVSFFSGSLPSTPVYRVFSLVLRLWDPFLYLSVLLAKEPSFSHTPLTSLSCAHPPGLSPQRLQHAGTIPSVPLVLSKLLPFHSVIADIFAPLHKGRTRSQKSVSNTSSLLYCATRSLNVDTEHSSSGLKCFQTT